MTKKERLELHLVSNKEFEWEPTFPLHPLCRLWGNIEEQEWETFRQSVEDRWLDKPIILYCGQVVDGAMRQKALQQLGHQGRYVNRSGGLFEVFKEIDRQNNLRRHVTQERKAAIFLASLDMVPELQQWAEREKKEALSRVSCGVKSEVHGAFLDKIAGKAGVSHGTMYKVYQCKKLYPVQFDQVVTGHTTCQTLIREATKHNKADPLPIGTWDTFYADPPWHYNGDSLSAGKPGGKHVRSTSPSYEYPMLTEDALCAMDIKGMSAKNAVCFMWSSVCTLEQALRVMRAWGFTYKSNYVWHMTNHGNPGAYCRIRHHHLLVGTRGNFAPKTRKLPNSVFDLPHARKGNSVKPDYGRELIETLFPDGKKIELFCRKAAPGWDAWGNHPLS